MVFDTCRIGSGGVVTEKGEGQKSTETWKIHNNLGGGILTSVGVPIG